MWCTALLLWGACVLTVALAEIGATAQDPRPVAVAGTAAGAAAVAQVRYDVVLTNSVLY